MASKEASIVDDPSNKKKHFSTIWSFVRWPYMVIILMVAVVVFMVGLACSVGYTGTTALKALSLTNGNTSWNVFLGLFTNSDLGAGETKGINPYLISTKEELIAKQDNQSHTINFDERLVRTLEYIAQPANTARQCGWNEITEVNPKHERVKVEVQTANNENLSDLSKVSGSSTSTLSRGTGARFSESGYMRCSWFYSRDMCPNNLLADNMWHIYGQYKILLDNQFNPLTVGSIPPDKPYISSLPFQPQCSRQIQCAVDNFPSTGTVLEEADDLMNLREKNIVLPLGENNPRKFDSDKIAPLNPNVFDVQPQTMPQVLPEIVAISGQAQQAAAYKAAQLGLELLTIDNAGCEKPAANVENQRNIPTTIIFSKWIADIMDENKVWANFMTIAKSSSGFPYNLQTESPLAGLSFDSALNNIAGVHFNY